MTKLSIWIGCNCKSNSNYDDLIYTINSIIKQQPVELVLSIYTNQKLDSLFDLVITSRIDFAIIEQPEPLSEKEHLQELWFCHKLETDTLVMFINSGDVVKTNNRTIKYQQLPNYFIDNYANIKDISVNG